MTYIAPLQDMRFVLEDLCGLDEITRLPGLEDATPDLVAAILEEAGKYAGQILAPLNHTGDVEGLHFTDGAVATPKGWKAAYDTMVEMGWTCPTASQDHGGMGLPSVVNACIQEMFSGANMAFQLCALLTQGAVEALEGYASDALQAVYLPRLVTGEWTGTMNLTEPQAGSDLAAIRTRAVPEGDHYRIIGQKIFISYGEHDLAQNIIHLVLARLPDAPEGVKGISLFVVPKVLVNADGSLGAPNDLRCVSIEHKMGIHASPTCTLAFGDNGGAVGYLVGQANHGLQYMFTMMNNARLNVGIEAIGVAEHACQTATAYAADRRQGKAEGVPGSATIIHHPDVRRMLGVMKARTDAARILAYRAARSIDFARHAADADTRARHQRRVDLLIPIVKAGSTEMGVVVTSLGMQVHGGMGYIEETGAAQFLRDARITTIYEGTTGIQSLDLIGRKILRDGGHAVSELLAEMRATSAALASQPPGLADWDALRATVDAGVLLIEETTAWLIATAAERPEAPAASAAHVLEVFALSLGVWAMADGAVAAARRIGNGPATAHLTGKLRLAEFFAAQVFPQAGAAQRAATGGAGSILALSVADLQVTA